LTGVPVGRRADFLVVGYSKPGVRCEVCLNCFNFLCFQNYFVDRLVERY